MATIIGSDFSETIGGTSNNDAIFGRGGNDTIYGRGGHDRLYGDGGDDFLYGGSGDDDLIGGSGINDLWGDTGFDRFIMSARAGAGFSDDLVWDFEFDVDQIDLRAWGVSDFSQVLALLGTDSFGDATLNAFWAGHDHALTLDGVAPFELIASDFLYANPAAIDATGTTADDVMFGSRLDDSLRGSGGDDILLGGLGHDLLQGGVGLDDLYGGDGSDVLDGGAGADMLSGLGGNDLIYVDGFADIVVEAAGGGSDRIFASSSYAMGAGVHVEILSTTNNAGLTAINLAGNELANSIAGNNGANVLNGRGGNDTLNGLGGADTFRFTTALGAGNVDTISGYSVADDKIEIDNAVFTGLAAGTLAAGAFRTGAAAAEADDRIIYNSATGTLLFDADGNGAGAAVQFATLAAGLAMSAGEFVVI